MLVVSYYYLTY